jgi:hypothetical protein
VAVFLRGAPEVIAVSGLGRGGRRGGKGGAGRLPLCGVPGPQDARHAGKRQPRLPAPPASQKMVPQYRSRSVPIPGCPPWNLKHLSACKNSPHFFCFPQDGGIPPCHHELSQFRNSALSDTDSGAGTSPAAVVCSGRSWTQQSCAV